MIILTRSNGFIIYLRKESIICFGLNENNESIIQVEAGSSTFTVQVQETPQQIYNIINNIS